MLALWMKCLSFTHKHYLYSMYIYIYIFIYLYYIKFTYVFSSPLSGLLISSSIITLPTANNKTVTQPVWGLALLCLTFLSYVSFARMSFQMCVE